jgi:hypothetical protein
VITHSAAVFGRLRLIVALQMFVGSTGLLCALPANAQAGATPEEVEAAYIHRFTGYVDWPPKVFADAAAPIVVGVVGSDRMFELLSAVVIGRPVQGRAVEVRRLSTPAHVADVQMVFIGKDAWKELPAWGAAAEKHAVVVTTDEPHGVEHGAALAYIQKEQRIRFEASLTAAEESGVKLSSRLLAVAERVVGTAR